MYQTIVKSLFQAIVHNVFSYTITISVPSLEHTHCVQQPPQNITFNFCQGARILHQVTAFALLFIAITANAELLSDCIVIQQHPHISNNLLIHHSSLGSRVPTRLISVRSSSVLRKPFNLDTLQDCVLLDTLQLCSI